MSAEPLFTVKDVPVLPDRGRFTALECIEEWNDHMRWLIDPATDAKADSLRTHYHESERDFRLLRPHLYALDGCQEIATFNELRDVLRERCDPPRDAKGGSVSFA